MAGSTYNPDPHKASTTVMLTGMAAPSLHKFLVYAPDLPDAAERRATFRAEHSVGARQLIASGVARVAGPTLPLDWIPGAEKKPIGSVFIYEAETIEEIKARIESDVFYLNDVWDKKNLRYYPHGYPAEPICDPRTTPRVCIKLLPPSVIKHAIGAQVAVYLPLSMSELHRFFIYLPDLPDAAERREAHRGKHFAEIKPLIDSGVIRVGGPLLSPESITGGEKHTVGSLIIYEAENIDVARKRIENDVFYLNDVWDKEKIVLLPFAAATAFP
uniref:YCII-related domain-containing protein n=1 Tax=Mycena chlorophos TaxID=658473 RepID=A0ABQ0LXN0_MYCCL|nr:predicted protein [Mycena chlorophos]